MVSVNYTVGHCSHGRLGVITPVQQQFLERVRLRTTDGVKARQMLVTLMADYWLDEGALAPSGVLVDLMGDFGVSETSSRTLLSRLAREGRTTVTRDGRKTFYCLSGEARVRLARGLGRIAAFDRAGGDADRWTCVAFSIPEGRRAVRQQLRKGLSWLGFAALYDGLWITPRDATEEAAELIDRLGVESASIFDGSIARIGNAYGNPTDAWDLVEIEDLYREFLAGAASLTTELEQGRFDASSSLVLRTELVNIWRSMPRLDPDLPTSLLPDGWPRSEAHATFVRLYDGLAPAAERRVKQALTTYAQDHLHHARAHMIGTH